MGVMERLSTAGLAPCDRLPFWNDLAERMIAPIRIEALGEQPFEASITRRRLRDCELVSPRSSPARIYSAPDHESAGVLNLQLQHVGRTTNHTAGRTCQLEEGDFLLYDPSQPLWLSFDEPTQVIVLRLPLAAAEARLPRLRAMAGLRMDGRRGPARIFSDFLRSAWTELEQDPDSAFDPLSDVLWPLLEMTFAGGAPVAPDRRETQRRALFAAIDEELCDPELDTHRIAGRLGVSTRTVQLLLADLGTTPTALIRDRRLEEAARRLAREGAACTVTDVAFGAGFNDLSGFCRAFRHRFGVSARDYRSGKRLDS